MRNNMYNNARNQGQLMWSVYILRCSDNSLYTGITVDLRRRLQEHNQDDSLAAAYTLGRRPVELVYSEFCQNRSDASRRESVIKRMSRRDKEILIKTNPVKVMRSGKK